MLSERSIDKAAVRIMRKVDRFNSTDSRRSGIAVRASAAERRVWKKMKEADPNFTPFSHF